MLMYIFFLCKMKYMGKDSSFIIRQKKNTGKSKYMYTYVFTCNIACIYFVNRIIIL